MCAHCFSFAIASLCLLAIQGRPQDKFPLQETKEVTEEAVKNKVRLQVSVPRKTYTGDALVLTITLENQGDDGPVFWASNKYEDFKIELRDAKGERVPLTRYAKKYVDPPVSPGAIKIKSGSYGIYPLLRGKKYQEIIKLPKVYDLTMAGEYSFSIETKIGDKDNPKKFSIKIKKVTFTIEENDIGGGYRDNPAKDEK